MQMFLCHCIVILLYIAEFFLVFIFVEHLWIGTRYFSKVSILLERNYRIPQDEVEIYMKVQVKSTTYARRKSC